MASFNGKKLVQYQVPNASQGNYYAPPGQSPTKIGISEYAQDWNTKEIFKKEVGVYEVGENVDVLSSNAAEIKDTWSIPGQSILTEGGGRQYFSMEKSKFLLVEK